MIKPEMFLDALREQIDFFAGVPDSLLKEFLTVLNQQVKNHHHQICANEGNAIAMSAGYHMATGKLPLVYMQNSGLGNAINPLTSLCHHDAYSIPMLLLIGWRGEPNVVDEPQHMVMGKITPSVLEQLSIDCFLLSSNSDPQALVRDSIEAAWTKKSPVAILCKKNSFAQAPENAIATDATSPCYALPMKRQDAVELILRKSKDSSVFVCTTGFTSREVFGQSKLLNGKEAAVFLNAGAMGHANQIALGLALGSNSKRVVCLDGDGAAIMHMGGLAIIGQQTAANLAHIVLNNGVHDSVGAQPTAGLDINMLEIARGCGYKVAERVSTIDELEQLLPKHLSSEGLTFLEIRIRPGGREDLPRPPKDFRQLKDEFMKQLSEQRQL